MRGAYVIDKHDKNSRERASYVRQTSTILGLSIASTRD